MDMPEDTFSHDATHIIYNLYSYICGPLSDKRDLMANFNNLLLLCILINSYGIISEKFTDLS